MRKKKSIPSVSEKILSHPYVAYLHERLEEVVFELEKSKGRIDELEKEVRRLKKQPKKPKIEPSRLDEDLSNKSKSKSEKEKRAGSAKRKKKKDLPIDEVKEIKATGVPSDWILVGHKPYVVQDVKIGRHNIRYEREVWKSLDGKGRILASLPSCLKGRTFGPELRRYVISLYNECHVTQPLIYAHLQNIGIDISTGQINFILNEDKANGVFGEELQEVVNVGIAQAKEIRTDDTGARHQGKTGFCNCINSDLFTYFESSLTKSRANFLGLLQLGRKEYHLTKVALSYCKDHGLGPMYLEVLNKEYHQNGQLIIKEEEGLSSFFKERKIKSKVPRRIITEGLLMGSLISGGFDSEKIIHSDGARQFNIFNHSLCWKHAERPLKKLFIHNERQEEKWNEKMNEFWELYQDLKMYKQVSEVARRRRKKKLEKRFDRLCEGVNNFAGLTYVLEDLKKKKKDLLLVLDYPESSLHNNDTEREIREYVKRRKISGSTRSETGRKSRDVFTSLKKTCRKLKINFWDYLLDRIQQKNEIPKLAYVLLQRSQAKFT